MVQKNAPAITIDGSTCCVLVMVTDVDDDDVPPPVIPRYDNLASVKTVAKQEPR